MYVGHKNRGRQKKRWTDNVQHDMARKEGSDDNYDKLYKSMEKDMLRQTK